MVRRASIPAVVFAIVVSVTAASPVAARSNTTAAAHRLIVVVKKSPIPLVEKRLSVLVLISQNGGAPAAAVVTPSKPRTVLLDNRGFYRVKAEIDAYCKGSCAGSYRISGSADHKLEVVPSCQYKVSGFVCSSVKIVELS